jgi:hypothetical protein
MLEVFLIQGINILRSGISIIFDLYFLWVPFVLWSIFWEYWKTYVVTEAVLKEPTTLLQIKVPREVNKSPRAMELFLQNIHQTGGEGNFFDKYWKGGTRPWFSLEIVSVEGEIRFYIWTRKKFVKLLETQLYSQYPGIEVVVDADDYTKRFKYDPETKSLFGTMFALTKDDPYPIKTYVDFGLDQDPKEEFKIDPIASLIEFLGSIGKGEQIWIQILVRAHKKYEEKKSLWELLTKSFTGFFEVKHPKYKNFEEKGKEIIEKLKEDEDPGSPEELPKKLVKKSKFQESVIEALERSVSKPAYDTAIRALYISNKENFDATNIAGLLGVLKQYNSDSLNGFKPAGVTSIDYPWQDLKGKKLAGMKSSIFNSYIKRAKFASRHNLKDFILNTEELATIFHFPSSIVETPTLPRIASKKAEPPTNLPL